MADQPLLERDVIKAILIGEVKFDNLQGIADHRSAQPIRALAVRVGPGEEQHGVEVQNVLVCAGDERELFREGGALLEARAEVTQQ